MDHFLYAIDSISGGEKWKFESDGAVTSTVYLDGGTVYFGSNDGYVYSLNAGSGELRWKGKTNGGIVSSPEVTQIGSEKVVIIGSNDGYVYGFKKSNGELIWGHLTNDEINEVNVEQEQILVASGHKVHSLSADRSCIITEPAEKTKIGYRDVEVQGKVFSKYSGAEASIRVNGGPWEKVETGNKSFVYYLDPNPYSFGVVEVECIVSDGLGQSDPIKLILIRSPEFEKPEFELIYPSSVGENEEVVIHVVDKESGEKIKNFNYKVYGKTYQGDDRVIFTTQGSEKVEIVFSKSGYETKEITINVQGENLLYIGVGVLVLVLLIIIWLKFLRKRKYES